MAATPTVELRVSVDVGARQYHVAIGLSSGEVLEEFAIAHQPEGFAHFFARIETHHHSYTGPVAGAMEGYKWVCAAIGSAGPGARVSALQYQ